MKLSIILFSLSACLMAPLAALQASSPEEQQCIKVLQSNASLQDKDAACVQLKRWATAESVPALAALLPDPQLSHSARFVLEAMSAAEAGEALRVALLKTEGMTQIGIVDSLAKRRDSLAVGDLKGLLLESDPTVASAAAFALGRIAGPEAINALKEALPSAHAQVCPAVLDSLLACGQGLLQVGDKDGAMALLKFIHESKVPFQYRMGAYRGMIQAAGDQAILLVTNALVGDDGADQLAAVQMARELPGTENTQTLAALLPKLAPVQQIALVECLRQRHDPVAQAEVSKLAINPDSVARVVALTALGELGDSSMLSLLLDAAASTDPAVQKAGRDALLNLHRGDVTAALLKQLATASAPIQSEVIRALGARADQDATPRLVELAEQGNPAMRVACVRALGVLGGNSEVKPLARWVLEAQDPGLRNVAQQSLIAVSQRIVGNRAPLDVQSITQGSLKTDADPEGRAALLVVCGILAHDSARNAIRSSLADRNAIIQAAAARALASTRDSALLPDLLSMASKAENDTQRVEAIRGAVRLMTEEEGMTLDPQTAINHFKTLLACAKRAEEKYPVLAGLGRLPQSASLELALPMLDDASTRSEAALAVVKVSQAILGAHTTQAEAALKKVIATGVEDSTRQAAQSVLKQIDAMASFITAWQVAGPYQQSGVDFAKLLDTPFAPETADARDISWKPMPTLSDAQRPWLLDLLKVYGGEQKVAYVRTAIHSDKDQACQLLLGSDDGVKVWLNGKVIYSNNTARPITVDSDKVSVQLKSGWNTLLLKITQNNQGWEYCARLAKLEGGRLEGVEIDPSKAQ